MSEFEIELADEWIVDESAASRLIAHAEEAELISSSARIDGQGSSAQLSVARDRLLSNAREAAAHAVANPELRITVPLEEVKRDGFSRLVQESLTTDGKVFFGQLICAATRSVLILTYEGPNTESAEQAFATVCGGVRVVK